MASISSVITCGFGTPGSASLVITDGFGTAGVTPAPSVQPTPTLGGSRFDRRKPKQRVIRYSDFETREAYAQAIAQAAMPMAQLPPVEAPADEWEDAEYAMIAYALIRMLH